METNRDKYRIGYDKISWSNTPRPIYQGGVRPIAVKPVGVVIEVGKRYESIIVK